jgi:hypothetical protein
VPRDCASGQNCKRLSRKRRFAVIRKRCRKPFAVERLNEEAVHACSQTGFAILG